MDIHIEKVNGLVNRYLERYKEDFHNPEITTRVRFEYFRDFFYVPLLDPNYPKEKRLKYRKAWSIIAGGYNKHVMLVDKDDNEVLLIPPLIDVNIEIKDVDKMHGEYKYASMKDDNIDLGAVDKVFDKFKDINHSNNYVASWDRVIQFVESTLKKHEEDKSSNDEDVGYEL